MLALRAQPQSREDHAGERHDTSTLSASWINEIVHGQRRITADTALRLSRYLGTSERFWMNLQAR